jgi:L-asparaginase
LFTPNAHLEAQTVTPLPKVCLIYTGGTIGMTREDGVLKPPKSVANFLEMAPELSEIADIDFVPLLNKDSTNMTPADWTLISTAIYERMAPGGDYVGFVVAHGTDTMHFSASAVAFAFGPNLNTPIVFTGAQTDPSVRHGDARINLIRAVKVALEDISEVVISFGDFVFRGCRAQKRDERRFHAFESPAFFALADITERILLTPAARGRDPDRPPITFIADFEADIFQVSLIPGLRPKLLQPLLDPERCHGIVLQSFGAGNVPDFEDYSFEPFIEEAVRLQIPIIITSQFPANSTLDTAYEPGVKAIRSGAIPTGNMTNAAATAKFRWVLAQVGKQIADGRVEPQDKLGRIGYLMAKPYVNEMDAPTDKTARPM